MNILNSPKRSGLISNCRDRAAGGVCLTHQKSVTLLELMKQFDLPRLVGFHHKINSAVEALRGEAFASATVEDMESDFLPETISELREYCMKSGFTHASQKAYTLHMALKKRPASIMGIELATKLTSIREDIDIGMFHHVYIQIEQEVIKYLNARPLFGDSVVSAFPSSVTDIEEAGRCLSVDLNSAAIFHLMHVVEWGIRALCANLGIKKIKNGPVEYATWDDILKQLPDATQTKINKMSRGQQKQAAQEFYYSTLKEIRGFKDAWRNHVMHTRAHYTRKDAEAVWSHVELFMKGIAEYGIKEVGSRRKN